MSNRSPLWLHAVLDARKNSYVRIWGKTESLIPFRDGSQWRLSAHLPGFDRFDRVQEHEDI